MGFYMDFLVTILVMWEKQNLDGEYGPLYSYGIKYINKNNPKFIFAENVSEFLTPILVMLTKILQELRDAGKYGYELFL